MRYLAAALAALASLASLTTAVPLACGARQYLDGAVCKQCPVTMMSCANPTTAITCARGRYLTSDKQCVLPRACPQNTFAELNKGTCTKCFVKDAATCKDATTTGTTSCMTGCLSGFSCPPAARLAGGMYCPNRVATPCPGARAQKCDASGVTTACTTGYNLASDSTCVKCIGAEGWDAGSRACTLSCPTGQTDGSVTTTRATYPDLTTGTCKTCNDVGAYSCDASGVSNVCLDGYSMSAVSTCIQCATGETFDTASKTCKASTPTCRDAQVGAGGWVSGAPMYLDPTTNQCVTCPSALPTGCNSSTGPFCAPWTTYSCDATGAATACINGYLYKGACTEVCVDFTTGVSMLSQYAPAPASAAGLAGLGLRFGVCTPIH